MSAICGIIDFDGAPVDPELLRSMADSSVVRGPDGVRFHLSSGAGFAHLAFHVTPESAHERQPLQSDDGRLVLVADVRLDNRDELIPQLAGRDAAQAKLITDADLLLLAYQTWGERCVERLLGDFVFAVWNEESRELFLARDPLGGYSVSYFQTGSRFVFASETAAILDLPFVEPRIDEETVTRTLIYLPTREEATFFEDVFFLPPAHCLRISRDQRRTWKYWEIDPDRRITYRSDDAYTEHFLELVNQAVACRLRSIGPVGISLSGGNDSTLLAACAARLLPETNPDQPRLRSFSYVFDRHPECDEREYIEPVVARYGLDATYIDGNDAWTFHNLHERPVPKDFLWTNCYVQLQHSVARAAAASGCRLLVDGHFGDALCSGANYWVAELLWERRFGALLRLLYQRRDDLDWRRDLLTNGLRQLAPNGLRRAYRAIRPRLPKPFVAGIHPDRLHKLEKSRPANPDPPLLRRLGPARRQRYRYLLDSSWAQGAAAARGPLFARAGLESVSPYFDRRLVEFMLAIPSEQYSRPGQPRFIQRNAMRRLLPAVVHERRGKTSYEALLREGLLQKERQTVRTLGEAAQAVSRGWIRADWLRAQIDAGDGWDVDGYPLSVALHLELWLRATTEAMQGRAKWALADSWAPRQV